MGGDYTEAEDSRKQWHEENDLIARHTKRMGYPAHKVVALQNGLRGAAREEVVANLRLIDRQGDKDRIISTNLGPNRKQRRRKEALAK